jgi:hypothetical protein
LRVRLFCAFVVASVGVAFLVPRIPQDPAYHAFADRRAMFGVPNFLDVVSNAPFAVVGALGVLLAFRERTGAITERWERAAFATFFASIALTAAGSVWYHLAPDNASLIWDRLPIAVSLASLFAAVLGERAGMTAGRLLFAPLVIAAAASVVWWRQTELSGAGDLRFYGAAQIVLYLGIAALMLLFPPRYTGAGYLWAGWIAYALAKVFELLDAAIFALGGAVSGHTLKHLAAGFGGWCIFRMLQTRRTLRADA